MELERKLRAGVVTIVLCAATAVAQTPARAGNVVSVAQFDKRVTSFLGLEISAHVADLKSLNPPQEYVVGARTGGDFSWGTFMRALASYSALSGDQALAGKALAPMIGQIGLIEARRGGKTFAQLYAAIALRSFGTDLTKNEVWQKLTPAERDEWRSLLDPSRFYDPKTRHVINLPENYFGVAARVVTIDYQLGLIKDRNFVDDVLNRGAQQFTEGNLYSDDGLPAGRYDRYSNEYARYLYMAAENAGRRDLLEKLTPTLKAQMRTWWDLLSPDGYGYPWGRSLGAISYEDTLEIVAFLAAHPQFRPAPLPQLASAYYAAWNWLENDFKAKPHLLNVFGFGRGNYGYITPEREWQQTAAFFGKASGAEKMFVEALKREGVAEFPGRLELPDVARFEFFRHGERPAGVWLVRRPGIRFALPIVSGTRAGMSDYLPAPYDLAGFAAPTEQLAPTVTPYLTLEDGRTVVAGDAADEIDPAADGMSLHAIWKRWAFVGGRPGVPQDVGLLSEVTWKIEDDKLVRTDSITATRPVQLKRFWVMVPSTCDRVSTSHDGHVASFTGDDAELRVSVDSNGLPLAATTVATGNGALGKSSRGPIPLYLELTADNVIVTPYKPITWNLTMQGSEVHRPAQPAIMAAKTEPTSATVRYYPAAEVEKSFSAAATLFHRDGVPYQVITGRRDKPGGAEIHLQYADVVYVVAGSATYVTGGTVIGGHSTAPGEIRGENIAGGNAQEVSKGDVFIIPAGTPHWIKDVKGVFQYYLVKVRADD